MCSSSTTDLQTTLARCLEAGPTVVRHGRNRGLGAAFRSGLERAREEGVPAAVYLDADGEYDPAQMLRLLCPIAAGNADYVLGSRFRGIG